VRRARLQINRRALVLVSVGKSENLAAICLWERASEGRARVRFVIITVYNACVRGGGAEWNEARAASTQGGDITNANHLISMLIETPTHLYCRSRALALGSHRRMKYICISIKIAKNDAPQRACTENMYACANDE
jgi:hypothetical protein